MSTILLAGGAEFSGQMADPDRMAIELAGGADTPIRIIPTAAAPDNNHERAGKNGVDWFKHLGATDVAALPIIDRASAEDPALSAEISQAGLIYVLGGFPRFLADTLAGSCCWQSILAALQTGVVIAGSSAGAMAVCDFYFDPGASRVREGLGLIGGACILPHHDTFGKTWAAKLNKLLPKSILVGIDEETGVVFEPADNHGRVLGKGRMTVYRHDQIRTFGPNQEFYLAL